MAGEEFPVCLVRGEKAFDCVESKCLNLSVRRGRLRPPSTIGKDGTSRFSNGHL